jgi:hypothetical protein
VSPLSLLRSIPHEWFLVSTFVLFVGDTCLYWFVTLGNVFYTMSGNALCLMPKIGLVESCEKKVCLDVLHIELVIMYKLFLSLRVYDFVIKFFVTCCCRWLLFACWHLSCSVVNVPCVVMSWCCCNTCCCGAISCVLRCACMCVLGGAYCVKTFLQMLMLLMLCVDQIITNNFYFFFLILWWDRYIVSILSSSCHVTSCRLDIVIMCY